MAVWYEVKHTEESMWDFLDANYGFHDFYIERVIYKPETRTAELFMKYDELRGSIILRFVGVEAMNVTVGVQSGYPDYLMGSTLVTDDDNLFLWVSDDAWDENSKDHVEEMMEYASWIRAERIIWAVSDENGNPSEMPHDKIEQEWTVYGKKKHVRFELTPCTDLPFEG